MLEKFCRVYQELSSNNLEALDLIYHPDIHFIDPAHEITGLTMLKSYFHSLYQNVSSIGFDFTSRIRQDDDIALEWVMSISHFRLNRGRIFKVNGMSRLHVTNSGLVDLHRDYFDLGAMLYERLPVLGMVVINLKRRLGK